MTMPEFINAILMCWLGVGALTFVFLHSAVKRFPQKIVFLIICGPIAWGLIVLIVFHLFYHWLTKE